MDQRESECARCGHQVTFIGVFPEGFKCPRCTEDVWIPRYVLTPKDVLFLRSYSIEAVERS